MLPNENEVAGQIASEHGDALRAMDDLHALVVEMLTQDAWTVPRRGLNQFVVITTAGLMMKAAKTFRSIQLLLERGLEDDSKALIRVLYETTVAVLFMLQKNTKQRVRQYHAHDAATMLKMIEHWKRTPGLKRQATKGALAAANALVAMSAKRVPAGVNFKRHWSGKGSFEEAVKTLGQDRMYATLYRFTSASTHATDFGAHVDALTDPNQLLFNLAPSGDSVRGLSKIAREVLWMLASGVDTRFRLGYEARLAPHRVMAI